MNLGQVRHAQVHGKIMCRTFLSGMPECRIALNDIAPVLQSTTTTPLSPTSSRDSIGLTGIDTGSLANSADTPPTGFVVLRDTQYHQCVRFTQDDHEQQQQQQQRTISFIPPDGEFQLLRYRVTSRLRLPFQAKITTTPLGTTRLRVSMTLISAFPSVLEATHIRVNIPVPNSTAQVKVDMATPASGKAKYVPLEEAIVWTLAKLPGEAQVGMQAVVTVASSHNASRPLWTKPPVSIQFHILMLTASGLMVRYLKVQEARQGYASVKWVRYSTQSDGGYQWMYT